MDNKTRFMKNLFLAFLMIQSMALISQNKDHHPIDISLNKCLEKSENFTTLGMVNCLQDAAKAWDVELNVQYNKLMETLDKKQKELLRISQRNWITYRDNELKFSRSLYSSKDGSIWQTVSATHELELIKKRVIELRNYRETTFTEEKY